MKVLAHTRLQASQAAVELGDLIMEAETSNDELFLVLG
jgi:hypothetical protein